MSATATQAAKAFNALLTLDPNRAARAELQLAGVGINIIEKLYPGGFIGLEPALIAHLAGVSDEILVAEGPELNKRGNEIWWNLPDALAEVSDIDSIADDEAASSGVIEQTLFDYLSARTDHSPVVHTYMRSQVVNDSYLFGLHIAQAAWAAHWLMTHRTEVPAASQAAVDELMLAVGRTFNL